MKTLVLIGGLLFCGVGTRAQKAPAVGTEAAQPFRGANVVIIHTTDSAKVALKQVASQLQSNGFVIDRLDYDLMSVSTKSRSFAGSGFHTMVASAAIEKGDVVLRGEWHGQLGQYSTTEPAAYTNNASKKALSELEAVAKAYPGGRVAYLQKKP
jgi:hypothetical protein